MADERCAFPGDAEPSSGSAGGRPPGRWLDRETAELLLRGESLETVDAASRDQAERLAKTLDGLIVESPPSAELPGEAAALAAFRAARSGARAEQAAAGRNRAGDSDAGLVRIGGSAPDPGRSRWGRPARFGLTAVLAAGMVGGVAFAATTGVLPTPFGHNEPGPGPVASVSAAASPDRPFVSPSQNSALGDQTPDGSTSPSTGPTTPNGSTGGGSSTEPGSGSDEERAAGGAWWLGAPSACRDMRDGRELTADRRRALEGAAGGSGPARVRKYCKVVLAGTDGTSRSDGDKGGGRGRGGQGDQNGKGGGQGNQGGDGDGHHIAPGSPAITPSPLPSLLPRQLVPTPHRSPKPPHSTL
ncbi:hypothetical protein [Streptomyces guryensis]|uniref:Uncharacterized protein n=1 Tax=Streptomyces guryensis TaxID=2886947 RepID=A0A9Q3VKR7_9ACTN|nr:hypothetical protein [Streptomyces guryensis]MCD9873512.1 hypothetical protein [Streptomyces guryensis]